MMSALYKCSNFQIRILCSEEKGGGGEERGGGGGGEFSQRLQLQVSFAGEIRRGAFGRREPSVFTSLSTATRLGLGWSSRVPDLLP